jgi:hypothetical protein
MCHRTGGKGAGSRMDSSTCRALPLEALAVATGLPFFARVEVGFRDGR